MKLQDLAQPQQSKQTAKVFESYFGQSVDFDRLTRPQARNMLNRVRGLIREHRAQPEFHQSEQNPTYLKLVVMEQGLSARIREVETLREASEVQQAQVVLAAQDMVDKMQKMLEEITAMQFKDLPALVDSIKNEVGQQQANQFNADATAALSGLVQNLQAGKQQMDAALGVVTGQAVAPMDAGMGADLGAGGEVDAAADLAAAGADLEAGADDLEAGAELAGDDLEEPAAGAADLGRGRR
jgi:hypothetical protein